MLPAWPATPPPTPTGSWRDSSKTPSSIYCALLPPSSPSYQGWNAFLSVFLLWVCRHVSEKTVMMCTDMWPVRHMLHGDNWSAWKSDIWVQPSSSWTIHLFSYITLEQPLQIFFFSHQGNLSFWGASKFTSTDLLHNSSLSQPQGCWADQYYKQIFEIFLFVWELLNIFLVLRILWCITKLNLRAFL